MSVLECENEPEGENLQTRFQSLTLASLFGFGVYNTPPSKESSLDTKDLQTHLGEARLRPYLELTGGHYKSASRLYIWNSQVGAAFFELLGVVEVALRNRLNSQIDAFCRVEGIRSWVNQHPDSLPDPLAKLIKGKLLEAHAKANEAKIRRDRDTSHPRRGEDVSDGDILAQFTLGTWHNLIPFRQADIRDPATNGYRRLLWDSSLSAAFQPETDPDKLHWILFRLTYFRNRIAHHEYLLGQSLEVHLRTHPLRERLSDIFEVLRMIDPKLEQWASGFNRVTPLLDEQKRPFPAP